MDLTRQRPSRLFAKTLKELRLQKNLSQRALEDRARLGRSYVSKMELALKGAPSPPSLERMCKALNLTVYERARLYKAAGYMLHEGSYYHRALVTKLDELEKEVRRLTIRLSTLEYLMRDTG